MQFGDGDLIPAEEPLLPSEIAAMANLAPDEPDASSPAPPEEAVAAPPPEQFDEKVKEPFKGLLYLGALTHHFEFAGHGFDIRTITTGEYLLAALATARYRETLGDSRAYVTAVVAACTTRVDGKDEFPQPLGPGSPEADFDNRFRFVRDHWFPWTIDAVYDEFLKLEERVRMVIEAMGKAQPSPGA